ncbi:MAG: hypothetical protein IJV66_03895 [Firmicutes bacterium]|nr:hypothetical protein [Bacillota bacterium]
MEFAPSDEPIPMKNESMEGSLSKAQCFSTWCLTAMSQELCSVATNDVFQLTNARYHYM